jgi:outer membrane protein assembly factor BamE (lipoprotein component of BamABCDE complex)
MNESSRRASSISIAGFLRPGVLVAFGLVCGTSACVTQNMDTGEMVPRGKQRYPWEKVKELAKQLKDGMRKDQVLLLMGSPAEVDKEEDQWIYLPERYAILIPAQALRLEFKNQILIDHGYRAIVLGAQL